MTITEADLTFSDKKVTYEVNTTNLKVTVEATCVTISDNGSFFFYDNKKFILYVDRPIRVIAL